MTYDLKRISIKGVDIVLTTIIIIILIAHLYICLIYLQSADGQDIKYKS